MTQQIDHRKTWDPNKYYYVILAGSSNRPEDIRLYYLEHPSGRTLLLFSTRERLEEYIDMNLSRPKAYMEMLESACIGQDEGVDDGLLRSLSGNSFISAPFRGNSIAELAVLTEADQLLIDPNPGINFPIRLGEKEEE